MALHPDTFTGFFNGILAFVYLSTYCVMIQTLRGYFLLSSSSISNERFFGTSTRFVRSAVAVRYHESRDQSKGSPIELPPNTKGIAVRFLKQKLIFGFGLEILCLLLYW